MSTFYSVIVKSIVSETADSVSISFNIPDTLKNTFTYKSGQYINVKVHLGGEHLVRSYSLCSAPEIDGDLTIAVKKIDGGKVSTHLCNNVKAGDALEIATPDGSFIYTPQQVVQKNYILIGAGSGITPLFSILKTMLEKEPDSLVHLYYSNRTAQDVIFKNALDNLASKYSNFKLKYIYTREGDNRLSIDSAQKLISETPNYRIAEFFICGPSGLINTSLEALQKLTIPKDLIHREFFTAKEAGTAETASIQTSNDDCPLPSGAKAKITLKYDGQEFFIECNEKTNIIDAAIDAGIDPPYSCLVAACCTCRAKVLKGNVELLDRDTLTDEEIKEGYVLTCQTRPKSSEIILDFDA